MIKKLLKWGAVSFLGLMVLGAIASSLEDTKSPDPLAAQLADAETSTTTTTTAPPATGPSSTLALVAEPEVEPEVEPEPELDIDEDEIAVLAVATTITDHSPELEALATAMIVDDSTRQTAINLGNNACDLAGQTDTKEQFLLAVALLWAQADATTQASFGDESGFATVNGALIGAFCYEEGERLELW